MRGQQTEVLVGPVTDDLINVEEYKEKNAQKCLIYLFCIDCIFLHSGGLSNRRLSAQDKSGANGKTTVSSQISKITEGACALGLASL